MHSHNYRDPEPFRDQIVVVIGSGPSARDLWREIAVVAKEVHMSSRSPQVKVSKSDKFNNVWQHAKIDYINKDGAIIFEDGFSVEADIIFHCTGYRYHAPFLKTNGIVRINDKRIEPLYKHVFPPQFAGRLSFVGVPERGVIFLVIDCQSRWIARVLSRKVSLPPKDEMLNDIEEHYRQMEENGVSKRLTHSLNFKTDYIDWVNAQIGMVMEKQMRDMYEYIFQCYMVDSDGYKDAFSQKYGI